MTHDVQRTIHECMISGLYSRVMTAFREHRGPCTMIVTMSTMLRTPFRGFGTTGVVYCGDNACLLRNEASYGLRKALNKIGGVEDSELARKLEVQGEIAEACWRRQLDEALRYRIQITDHYIINHQ